MSFGIDIEQRAISLLLILALLSSFLLRRLFGKSQYQLEQETPAPIPLLGRLPQRRKRLLTALLKIALGNAVFINTSHNHIASDEKFSFPKNEALKGKVHAKMMSNHRRNQEEKHREDR
ncbi:hypothetical protein DdX_18094 [Ditylenchus destructor]|uniref:Uncharacterized protein n=1 Tax=Ditylenchus destructor TaxID=166010 RepID=A0AAD4QYG6_9BILA|nr:hypothetical protein DdX_18094 [Ditylenchus destructor]